MPSVIELTGLTKYYPGRRDSDGQPIAAVEQVDLRVPAGQVFGLLGRNGAGKSSIVRMIATLLAPTSGRVTVCGLDADTQRRQVRALLGVALGGERSVYWKLTARQNLEYFAALHGSSRRRSRQRINEVLHEMDLADRADDYVERFSTGMRQRLVLARALLNRPQVLLLDEPASGLDPHAAENLHNHVRQLRDAGHTILLTTHDMAEADLLSDQVGIIHEGRLRAVGSPQYLKRSAGLSRQLQVQLSALTGPRLDAFLAELQTGAFVSWAEDHGSPQAPEGTMALTLANPHAEDLAPWFFNVATRHSVAVRRMENEPVSLRDIFLHLTGRPSPDEPAAH